MAVDLEESNKDYGKEIELVKNHTEDWVSTPALAQQIHGKTGYEWGYFRHQLLPGILKYLEKEGVLVREERHEGGEPTHYWRLKQ